MNWICVGVLAISSCGLSEQAQGIAEQAHRALDLNQRGVDADARGDSGAAEKLYQSALAIWRSLGPVYEAHAAVTMVNLGEARVAQGRWDEGAPFLEEALPMIRRTLGPAHIYAIGCLNVLGVVATLRGEMAKAEAFFAEALPLARAMHPENVQLAHTLSGIAGLRLRAGRLDDALKLADEALEISVKAEGDGSPEAALQYSGVATIHRVAGRYERAVPLFRKAHEIYDRLGINATSGFAMFLGEEAMALADGRQFVAAEKDLTRARQILAGYPSCQFQMAVVNGNLGYLRMRQEKYAEADKLLSGALAAEERTSPGASFQIKGTLRMLAAVREKEKRFAEAAELKNRAESL